MGGRHQHIRGISALRIDPSRPFLLGVQSSFPISAALTGVGFFLIGSFKAYWSTIPWWRSGLGTLFVGGIAATLAFLAGLFLKNLGF